MIKQAFLFLVLIGHLAGQEQQIIPSDVRIGKLKNGLTYYIKHNEFPKEKASLRLVVKVGSINETDEEQGIAHFVEHMVFRGSDNFADWEIINYLESIGAQFGPDTNAITSFDETCYYLTVPLERDTSLETAILILSDYAGRAHITDEMIAKERTVIMDEYNISQKSSQSRIGRNVYTTFFADSLYPKRFPIGKEEVILHCDAEVIRKFYKKWYRPNRMAVVAVGDFEIDLVEKEIARCFSDLKPDQGVSEPSSHVQFPPIPISLFTADPEELFVEGGFTLFYRKLFGLNVTQEGLRNDLIIALLGYILNHRFNDLLREPPSPFLCAAALSVPFTTYHDALRFHFIGFADRPLEGAKALYREVERLKKFGPLQSELDREIARLKVDAESVLANSDRVEHEVYIQAYVDHFLHNRGFSTVKEIYEFKKVCFDSITKDDLTLFANLYFNLDGMHRILSMPREDSLSVNAFEKGIQEVKNEILEPMNEISDVELILKARPTDTQKFLPQNISFYPTSLEKGQILIELIAPGGKTLFSPNEYASLELAPSYMIQSGFGNLKGKDLQNFLEKRGCSLSFGIQANLRHISISGPTKEKETLFKTLQAIFFEKRFEPTAWPGLIEQWREIEQQRENNPQNFFIGKAVPILHNNHPFFMWSRAADANENLAKKCAEQAFSSPQEFSIVITGDFNTTEMKKLVNQYLSSPNPPIPTPTITIPTIPPIQNSLDQTIYRGNETHGLTLIFYRARRQEGLSHFSMQALTHILTHRALQTLRQQSGDTYGVTFTHEFPLAPSAKEAYVLISFTSTPDKAAKLKGQVDQVIEQFLKEGPTQKEIATAREIISQQIKEGKESNVFWSNLHKQAFLCNRTTSELLAENEKLPMITANKLHELAISLFKDAPKISLSLAPEKL